MNESDIKNYLLNPNTSELHGFLFRVNYSNLSSEISNEVISEEITKISSQYKPKYFNLLFKISQMLGDNSPLKSLLIIDPESVKTVFLKKYETKVFNFNSTGQLIVLASNSIMEIEELNESTFELKIFSLDASTIPVLKSEVSGIYASHNSVFTAPEDTTSINTKLNELYVLALLNLIVEDFHSFPRTYSLFTGLNSSLKNMNFGLVKKCNHALHLNEDSLYVGAIALISLIIENRLANIYEIQNTTYNDDKTLGQLITELNQQRQLNGIEIPLNNFKDIRNNLIHHHRRTFDIYNSFTESIKYLGQFIMWCKDNGKL
ncbi:MAG: hypothetical protein KJ771_08940 [Nanoarchaeota archaeon]|nr:hypothetical protein [Nanoarchaeota archaeon]